MISSLITGQPVLFGDAPCHGMAFSPAGTARARVLLLPPLFEERRCAHRALITCARALAAAGAAVLVPDLSGTGNSGGRLAALTLEHWQADLRAAAAALPAPADVPFRVVGCRAGALLATLALADGLTAERLLLWQPLIGGKEYLRNARKRRMIQDSVTGGTPPEVGEHEVEGEVLSPALYAALEGLRLPERRPSGEVRLLQCSFTEKLLTEYERLLAKWGGEPVRTRNIVAEPFWNPHSPSDYQALAAALVEEVLA